MDFSGLNEHLLQSSVDVLSNILQGGKVNGHEYECASVNGGKGTSCKTNINTGVGADFATGETWSDLISLYALANNLKMSEAFLALADKYGFIARQANTHKFNHYKLGDPAAVWAYHSPAGEETFYIARFETSEGKQSRPVTIDETGKPRFKGPARPYPLYNLHLLAQYPDRPVLVVEGEKAADAAKKLVGDNYVVTCWPFGVNSVVHADLAPLYGRKILLWPDADRKTFNPDEPKPHGFNTDDIKPYAIQPGPAAMITLSELLVQHAQYVKIINVGIDQGRMDGWDAADAVEDGWTWDRFFAWAKQSVITVKPIPPAEPETEVLATTELITVSGLPIAEMHGMAKTVMWDRLHLSLSGTGQPIANLDNVVRILEAIPDFRGGVWYDEFHQKIFTTFRCGDRPYVPISDSLEYELTIFLQRTVGFSRISDNLVSKSIAAFSRRNTRNEPKDWITSLSWDGTPRIDTLFPVYASTPDSQYSRAVSRNFMLSMVARVLKPGCKADCMIILEGKQGKRKSTLLRAIAGPEWHTEAMSSINEKDFYQAMSGKLIIEFADLSTWRNTDKDKLKQMLSNEKDTYRAPYDRHPDDHRRCSIFAGTTNDHAYLQDDTGARRYWPIITGDIDINGVRDNRDQLFAEAAHIYLSEAVKYDDERTVSSWWNVPESAKAEQEERRQRDPWEDDISSFLRHAQETTTNDIMERCLRIEIAKRTRRDEIRIGRILLNLGYEKHRIMDTGRRGSKYVIPGYDARQQQPPEPEFEE